MYLGLYSLDSSNNATLIGSTADFHSTGTTVGTKKVALTSGVAITAGTMYAVGYLAWASAASTPNVAGWFGNYTSTLKITPFPATMYGTSLTALPSTITYSSSNNYANVPYFQCLSA